MHISIKIEQVGNMGNYFNVTCGRQERKMVSVNEKWLQDIIHEIKGRTSGFRGELLPAKKDRQCQEKSSSAAKPTPTASAKETSQSETKPTAT